MKRHPDSEWYVKPSIIKGDKEQVKRDELKKSIMPYNNTPGIEFDRKLKGQ